jgi:amino acid permease
MGDLFSREEVLGGLSAKRARALLYVIESRTAHLALRDREVAALMAAPMMGAPAPFVASQLLQEDQVAAEAGSPLSGEDRFLQAFGWGRQRPARLSIRQIERYADDWSTLIPGNPRLRAAVARLLGKKYRFTQKAVPALRAALGLDEAEVQQAYQRLYGEPLEAIYAPQVTPAERWRWALEAFGKWLDALPPFWLAFAFTLTETVGLTILALPIAMALVGPLAGAALLIVVGAISLLTVVCMAEAVVRSGVMRYGSAFFGRLVADLLGNAGSLVLTAGGALFSFLILQPYYVGFSTVLADATQVPPAIWVAVLFAVCLYFVSRRSLHATAASALLVGTVNIGLILALSALALAHAQGKHLRYVNLRFLVGHPLDASLLKLVFGVGIVAYFGHFSIGNCARLVLRRDPSGRGLIRGCAAAQVAAMFLYCLFVVAVNGAIGPQVLAGYAGTALEPLARVAGPGVRVLGSVFVILGMGMGSVHFSLGLFNLVGERLPARPRFLATLYAGGERLVLEPRSGSGEGPRIGLTYRGLRSGRPRLRIDVQAGSDLHTRETTLEGEWTARELFNSIPALRGQKVPLTLEVIEASEESVSLVAHSTMVARYESAGDGSGLLRLVELSDAFWQVLPWILRRGEVTLTEAAAHTGLDPQAVQALLDTPVGQSVVQKLQDGGEPRYRARLSQRRRRSLPDQIWNALEEPAPGAAPIPSRQRSGSPAAAERFRGALLGDRGRLFLSVSPLVAGFLLAEWSFFRGSQSFTGLQNFLGLVVVSVIGGIFPVLLLAASRRKGELVPGYSWPLLGSPLVLVVIYLTFLSSLLVHGLFIWQSLPARATVLATAALALGATLVMARRGAFAPRAVVELREDLRPGGRALFSVMASGQPLAAEVQMDYADAPRTAQAASGEMTAFASLRRVTFSLPATPARELKVWAHRVTPEGDSEPLPALAEVRCGSEMRRVDLGLCGGQALLPIPCEACQVEITLGGRPAPERRDP